MNIRFSQPPSSLVKRRYSCRTFSRSDPDADAMAELGRIASLPTRGLLEERVRFSLVEEPEMSGVRFADYGLIAGARFFLLGAVSASERCRESYAFLLEHLVLKAADLGLESCWVGYFHQEFFKDFRLEDGERRPAVAVVGKAAERPRFRDRVIRSAVRAAARKPWKELFFAGSFSRPLQPQEAGDFSPALEMVRLAPSSGNTQPWRVVRESDSTAFHFFMKRVRRAYAVRGQHEVDIGIAMCHFDLACREAGRKGCWVLSQPDIALPSPDFEYRWTWRAAKGHL